MPARKEGVVAAGGLTRRAGSHDERGESLISSELGVPARPEVLELGRAHELTPNAGCVCDANFEPRLQPREWSRVDAIVPSQRKVHHAHHVVERRQVVSPTRRTLAQHNVCDTVIDAGLLGRHLHNHPLIGCAYRELREAALAAIHLHDRREVLLRGLDRLLRQVRLLRVPKQKVTQELSTWLMVVAQQPVNCMSLPSIRAAFLTSSMPSFVAQACAGI